MQSLLHTYKRYRTLHTHKIAALPVVILMPHSACNCRCVMCDIWKDNKNAKQLTEDDITGLLDTFRKLQTKNVVMSGGEALLNTKFFRFCELLQREGITITLLSTGLLLPKYADQIAQHVRDVIISLDGDQPTHDRIRNIPDAFRKLAEGVKALRSIDSKYKITGRTVIHKQNFEVWPRIISAAHEIGLDQISFLPADVSSQAFNRETPWDVPRQQEVALSKDDLPLLFGVLQQMISDHKADFDGRFIAESPEKLMKIYSYYRAIHGIESFPYKQCNAPWVSTVIEADGSVRPCFFHSAIGNIRTQPLSEILNSGDAIQFRKTLDMDKDETCKRCVCYLNLSPATSI